jgi:hypothetical protein
MSKCFVRTRGESDEWPGCEYRDDRQAKRAARAAGPKGDTGDTRVRRAPVRRSPPWPPATPTVPMAGRVGLIRPPHSDTRLARRIRRAWEGTLLIPAGRTHLTRTGCTMPQVARLKLGDQAA